MKKIWPLFICILSVLTAKCPCENPILELKAGYFFFTDSKLQDIYDSGGIDVQLATSYPLWQRLYVYGAVGYIQKDGHSLGNYQSTRIQKVPLSLGLKPVFHLHSQVQYYFTIGPRYTFVRQSNDSSYVNRHLNENGIGAFVNTGFLLFPYPSLVIDLFGEYSYERMKFSSSITNVFGRTIDVGGFTFGGGIGYVF